MNTLVILIPLLLIALSACGTKTEGPVSGTSVQTAAAEPSPAPQPPAPEPAAPSQPAATEPETPAQPIPPAAPAPPAIPMPAKRVFLADFTGPSIGLTGFMVRKMPPEYSSGDPNAKWFTNPAKGRAGFACVDPGPNEAYHTEDGCLVMTPDPNDEGFPIISPRTFSKDHHLAIACEMWFDDLGGPSAYAGPVCDNGEDNYIALYGGNPADGKIWLFVDQTAKGSQAMTALELKTWHVFQIHYYPDGSWRIACNGTEYFPTGIDNPLKMRNDPRLSVFAGVFKKVKVRKLEAWSDDPAEKGV